MKYRKRPVVIDASQWFRNGDHPKDDCYVCPSSEPLGQPFLSEGKIVRRFNHPFTAGDSVCPHCRREMREHGWIDTLEGGHNVCPGDWIITGVAGEHYPCKPEIFAATYDLEN